MVSLRTATAVIALFGWSACVLGLDPPDPTNLVEVKGGPFLFGITEPCFNDNQTEVACASGQYGMPRTYPTVVVNLDDFAIEEHEVTNIQYEYCVARGECPEPEYNNTIGIEHYHLSSTYEDYPVVNVTPAMATAYCTSVGRRLPTEAEWERVAAGGAAKALTDEDSKRKYPFQDGKDSISQCVGLGVAHSYCTGLAQPAKVTSSTDDWVEENGVRVYDLTGNVAELVAGFYREELTCKTSIFEGTACKDCFACTTPDCIQTCYLPDTCPECRDNPDCYRQCVIPADPGATPPEPGFTGIPRCISYGSEVLAPAQLVADTGNEWLARGGSFNDGSNLTCRALTTDRNSQHRRKATGKSDPVVGFRCVEDR